MVKKNMMKSLVTVGVVASAVLIVGFIFFEKNKNLGEITKYVNNNYSELEEVASNYMKGNKVKMPEHITNIEVCEAVDKHNTIVQFTYQKNNKTEYGFYYSVGDRAEAFNNIKLDLLELGGDKWMWSGEEGSEGVTSKIRPSWYYYKVTK